MRGRWLLACGMVLALVACTGGDSSRTMSLPDAARPAAVISRGDAHSRAIALTFELDGDDRATAEVLDTLRTAAVRGTFAVSGRWAEANPDLLNAIAANGHQIINLGYNHTSMTGASTGTAPLTAAERALELSRTETTVFRMSSRSTRPYFRPPYGDIDDSVLRDAGEAGYAYVVLWSIDARSEALASAGELRQLVRTHTRPGDILVMNADAATASVLTDMLADLVGDGYTFATVQELIE